MDSTIPLPDNPAARGGSPWTPTPETLRAGIERRTLRMIGLADRLREAAGT